VETLPLNHHQHNFRGLNIMTYTADHLAEQLFLKSIREITTEAESALGSERYDQLIAELAGYTAHLMALSEQSLSCAPAERRKPQLRVVK
jgi:hypothetical protein